MPFNKLEAQKAVGFHKYKEGSEKPTGDFYATPEIAVIKLLERSTFSQPILEPCCGNGAISRVLEANNYQVISRDLYDWGYGEPNRDFLSDPIIDVGAVVTNPPFSYALEFTEKSMLCTQKNCGRVAILNRIQWLEGVKRYKFFIENRLAKVFVFTRRIPRMHRYDFTGKPGTSLLCFAWFIFDWKHEKGFSPELGWLI